jgi:hypothetical protein
MYEVSKEYRIIFFGIHSTLTTVRAPDLHYNLYSSLGIKRTSFYNQTKEVTILL